MFLHLAAQTDRLLSSTMRRMSRSRMDSGMLTSFGKGRTENISNIIMDAGRRVM